MISLGTYKFGTWDTHTMNDLNQSSDLVTDQQDDMSVIETETKSGYGARRLLPIYIATSLSVVWVALVLYFLIESSFLNSDEPIILTDVAVLFAGFIAPIVLIWLVTLAFQRSDPLLERRLAISKNLYKALSPVEQAEQRFVQLHKKIEKELINIEAVADLASDRIQNLEGRFQDQISNLFTATANAEEKTEQIKSSIGQEREAVEALTAMMHGQFAMLEDKLSAITAQMQQAGEKASATAETATTHSQDRLTVLHDKIDEMEDRLNQAGDKLTTQAGSVENLSLDMELRLQNIQENISSGIDKMRGDVSGLETRSHELTEHMKTQGQVLNELAELAAKESQKIESSLKTHVTEVRLAAEEALEKTDTVSNLFSDKAKTMSDTVIATVDEAKSLLDQAGAALDKHCEEALSTSSELNERAMEQTRKTASAVQEHAEEVNQLLLSSLENARQALDETAMGISNHAAAAENTTKETAETVLSQLKQFQVSLESEIHLLEEKAAISEKIMLEKAEAIHGSAQELEEKSKSLEEQLAQSNTAIDEKTLKIDEALANARDQLINFESEMEVQRTAMVTQSEESANKVIDAAAMFKDHANDLSRAANESENAILQSSLTVSDERKKLEAHSRSLVDSIESEKQSLINTGIELTTSLESTHSKLASASSQYMEERDKLVEDSNKVVADLEQASDKMAKQVEDLTESATSSTSKLENATQILMDETDNARNNIEKAVQTASDHLSSEVKGMGDKAAEKITVMQEEMQMTMARLLSDYQDAAEAAEKESALLSSRIGNEADKIAERAESFVNRTSEIEKRIAENTKNDFARTSQMLLESLQSLSIDIHKLLASDIPDTMWQAYLNGDRSIFSRGTIKMGTRKTRSTISSKFHKDKEFRESVGRYMRDFEGLMERAMHGDRGNTLSVTLISSDMGKLYVLLAQSMKKIS